MNAHIANVFELLALDINAKHRVPSPGRPTGKTG